MVAAEQSGSCRAERCSRLEDTQLHKTIERFDKDTNTDAANDDRERNISCQLVTVFVCSQQNLSILYKHSIGG